MMQERHISIDGIRVPRFFYGTAWKEDETQRLTELALHEGFRGIDSANQRCHYDEAAVGRAIAGSIARGLLKREELFLQTKFTFRRGQDHRLPYDPAAPISTQVEQSFASSLEHLGVNTIDSYVLHGPSVRTGLAADDWSAWRAMEAIHDSGRIRFLGVSNVSVEQVAQLCEGSRVRPRFVQNRCYASQGWDRRVRQFCTASGMVYQGFSLLTANRNAMAHPALARIGKLHARSLSQVVFRFALDVGMIVLTGTTSKSHMEEDLAALDFKLGAGEIEDIEALCG